MLENILRGHQYQTLYTDLIKKILTASEAPNPNRCSQF